MSYEFAAELQRAIYQRLAADAALAALVGGAIHDAPPEGRPDDGGSDYVTIGEESVRPFGSMTSRGAVHDFSIVVHSNRDGFDAVKRIAGAVCASLVDGDFDLEAGRVVALRFLQAKAERGPAPEKRRVALRFRAVVDRDG